MELDMSAAKQAITRLAPSPTGALHLGNARTFLVNWALARQGGWKVVLRIEDLDGPRVKKGAGEAIAETLRWLGMDWDEGPLVQSEDLEPYREAMRALAGRALAYPSAMTRGEIEGAGSAPQEGARESVFPAELRPDLTVRDFDAEERHQGTEASGHQGENWRFVVGPEPVRFADRFMGAQEFEPAKTIGDFVVWTKRGTPAYQLAVVVDDHRQGVTQVVRGNDLLDSAARQLLLYRALGYVPEPAYSHLPLVRGGDGKRLAKRHGDTRIEYYRGLGVPPERVIGLVAFWSGVTGRREAIGAGEFVERFRLDTMSREDVVFGPEDDAWLRHGR
jgi:glutamyl-tRNA synthetase